VLAVAGCTPTDDASQIVRTTTDIAGAGVVGAGRDTRTACSLPTSPDGDSPRRVGDATVPADPQRIVVLDTPSLDAVCALGLWQRVVGAATITGSGSIAGGLLVDQPRYLGTGVRAIPSIGPVGAPDPQRIAALHPDLIVGVSPVGSADQATLSAIAPTLLTSAVTGTVTSPTPLPIWQARFLVAAEAMDREQAGQQALDDYRAHAHAVGVARWAAQTQASVVRFTGDTITREGSDTFAAEVLSDIGVQRPLGQRDGSFPIDASQPKKAEGDLIYAILAGTPGKTYAATVFNTDAWRDLGAAEDNRVFAVDDTVWNGQGLAAARALVDDVDDTLNGYVTN
jgi:iron complex transport system substrate-binding protein